MATPGPRSRDDHTTDTVVRAGRCPARTMIVRPSIGPAPGLTVTYAPGGGTKRVPVGLGAGRVGVGAVVATPITNATVGRGVGVTVGARAGEGTGADRALEQPATSTTASGAMIHDAT